MEGLNSTHLGRGSSMPPSAIGSEVRLYSMRFCPYVERVMLALQLKNIQSEVVNINLQERPEWYSQINPLGKVPSIEHGGKIIYESLVIVEYLDHVFPAGRRILPEDPYERASQKMLLERLSGLAPAMYHWITNRQDQQAIRKLHDSYDLYETSLTGNFLAGSNPGYVDHMVWPWVERMEAVTVLSNGEVRVTQQQYPKLAEYIERMNDLPEVKALAVEGRVQAEFVESRLAGTPRISSDAYKQN